MTSTLRGAEPILLAFSGGLDTSFCVPWLKDTYERPVITVTVDTGGLDDGAAAALATRPAQLGAIDHHLIDARTAYFDQVLKFLIMGNIRRGGMYPLCVRRASAYYRRRPSRKWRCRSIRPWWRTAAQRPATIRYASRSRCAPWRRISRSSLRYATARSSERSSSSTSRIAPADSALWRRLLGQSRLVGSHHRRQGDTDVGSEHP